MEKRELSHEIIAAARRSGGVARRGDIAARR
jgi:hypothetical protein